LELKITDIATYKVIKISGKVDWENARTLDREIQQIIDGGCSHIAFNLDEVTFICSGGIGALVYNLNKVKKNGGAIYIISSSEYVNYIFETLKFDVVFDGLLFTSYEQFQEKVLDHLPA
jgi:anti-anti-sigma factor